MDCMPSMNHKFNDGLVYRQLFHLNDLCWYDRQNDCYCSYFYIFILVWNHILYESFFCVAFRRRNDFLKYIIALLTGITHRNRITRPIYVSMGSAIEHFAFSILTNYSIRPRVQYGRSCFTEDELKQCSTRASVSERKKEQNRQKKKSIRVMFNK